MSSRQQQTIDHNLTALGEVHARQARAATETCPTCGAPAQPAVLARFGHCLSCQRAAWGAVMAARRPARRQPPARTVAVLERRSSGSAGPHGDRRLGRQRDRGSARRTAIRESG